MNQNHVRKERLRLVKIVGGKSIFGDKVYEKMQGKIMFELSQRFYFEAAHTLDREIEIESSRRIHGHTYHAEVTVRGLPDSLTGMIVDLGYFRAALKDVHDRLDHRFLDEIPELGAPTLENLCVFISKMLVENLPGLHKISISRKASGDSCTMICT